MTLETRLDNQLFTMHASGALFWNEKKILFISDVHLGKVVHFRKNGFPIPNNAAQENFDKLMQVVTFFNPKRIVFLGDLFHSTQNSEWNLFVDWCQSCPSEITLIAGNHDVIPDFNFHEIGIEVISSLKIDTFLFTHHPTTTNGFFNCSGHIHPGIILRGLGKNSLKLPCFFQQKSQLILPAFGTFTGLGIIKPKEGDQIFVLTQDEVIQVNSTFS